MRAMQSYDKILLKNNFTTDEFVITILKDETLEGINELVNSDKLSPMTKTTDFV